MAINRGKKEASGVPEKLANMLLPAFTHQALAKKYDDIFSDEKKDIVAYLEKNDDGFEIEMSKGFQCDQGQVIYQSRSNWKFDTDKILALVESGHVTLATLVNACSFNAEKLKTAIGEKEFGSLATQSSTEYLTMKANAEFKAKVDEQFGSVTAEVKAEKPAKVETKVEAKVEAKPAKSDSLAKAKAAAAKAKSKSKSADQDLEDILGE